MPGKQSPAAIEKDALVQTAVNAYLSGRHESITKADMHLMLPSTVKHHVKGRLRRCDSHEKQMILTKAEESELARWITQLAAIGYAPGYQSVREMTKETSVQQIYDNELNVYIIRHLAKNQSNASLIVIQL